MRLSEISGGEVGVINKSTLLLASRSRFLTTELLNAGVTIEKIRAS